MESELVESIPNINTIMLELAVINDKATMKNITSLEHIAHNIKAYQMSAIPSEWTYHNYFGTLELAIDHCLCKNFPHFLASAMKIGKVIYYRGSLSTFMCKVFKEGCLNYYLVDQEPKLH